MPIIKQTKMIHAPIEVCFNLARSVDIHMETSVNTKEKAVAGVTSGLLGARRYCHLGSNSFRCETAINS